MAPASDAVFLCNSMPGYFALDNISDIYSICKSKECILINDCAGSIGTPCAKVGDIIIGSFGRWKPVNLEYGGFIASSEHEYVMNVGKDDFDVSYKKQLLFLLENLDLRLEEFSRVREKIISDLSSYNVIHKKKTGINVVVLFDSEEEKNKIITYCEDEKLDYTICPRYIRVMQDAVSIEVKRI